MPVCSYQIECQNDYTVTYIIHSYCENIFYKRQPIPE